MPFNTSSSAKHTKVDKSFRQTIDEAKDQDSSWVSPFRQQQKENQNESKQEAKVDNRESFGKPPTEKELPNEEPKETTKASEAGSAPNGSDSKEKENDSTGTNSENVATEPVVDVGGGLKLPKNTILKIAKDKLSKSMDEIDQKAADTKKLSDMKKQKKKEVENLKDQNKMNSKFSIFKKKLDTEKKKFTNSQNAKIKQVEGNISFLDKQIDEFDTQKKQEMIDSQKAHEEQNAAADKKLVEDKDDVAKDAEMKEVQNLEVIENSQIHQKKNEIATRVLTAKQNEYDLKLELLEIQYAQNKFELEKQNGLNDERVGIKNELENKITLIKEQITKNNEQIEAAKVAEQAHLESLEESERALAAQKSQLSQTKIELAALKQAQKDRALRLSDAIEKNEKPNGLEKIRSEVEESVKAAERERVAAEKAQAEEEAEEEAEEYVDAELPKKQDVKGEENKRTATEDRTKFSTMVTAGLASAGDEINPPQFKSTVSRSTTPTRKAVASPAIDTANHANGGAVAAAVSAIETPNKDVSTPASPASGKKRSKILGVFRKKEAKSPSNSRNSTPTRAHFKNSSKSSLDGDKPYSPVKIQKPSKIPVATIAVAAAAKSDPTVVGDHEKSDVKDEPAVSKIEGTQSKFIEADPAPEIKAVAPIEVDHKLTLPSEVSKSKHPDTTPAKHPSVTESEITVVPEAQPHVIKGEIVTSEADAVKESRLEPSAAITRKAEAPLAIETKNIDVSKSKVKPISATEAKSKYTADQAKTAKAVAMSEVEPKAVRKVPYKSPFAATSKDEVSKVSESKKSETKIKKSSETIAKTQAPSEIHNADSEFKTSVVKSSGTPVTVIKHKSPNVVLEEISVHEATKEHEVIAVVADKETVIATEVPQLAKVVNNLKVTSKRKQFANPSKRVVTPPLQASQVARAKTPTNPASEPSQDTTSNIQGSSDDADPRSYSGNTREALTTAPVLKVLTKTRPGTISPKSKSGDVSDTNPESGVVVEPSSIPAPSKSARKNAKRRAAKKQRKSESQLATTSEAVSDSNSVGTESDKDVNPIDDDSVDVKVKESETGEKPDVDVVKELKAPAIINRQQDASKEREVHTLDPRFAPIRATISKQRKFKAVERSPVTVRKSCYSKIPSIDFALEDASPKDIAFKSALLKNVPSKSVTLKEVPLKEVPPKNVILKDVPLKEIPPKGVTLKEVPLKTVALKGISSTDTLPKEDVNKEGFSRKAPESRYQTEEEEEELDTLNAIYTLDPKYIKSLPSLKIRSNPELNEIRHKDTVSIAATEPAIPQSSQSSQRVFSSPMAASEPNLPRSSQSSQKEFSPMSSPSRPPPSRSNRAMKAERRKSFLHRIFKHERSTSRHSTDNTDNTDNTDPVTDSTALKNESTEPATDNSVPATPKQSKVSSGRPSVFNRIVRSYEISSQKPTNYEDTSLYSYREVIVIEEKEEDSLASITVK